MEKLLNCNNNTYYQLTQCTIYLRLSSQTLVMTITDSIDMVRFDYDIRNYILNFR